MTLSRSHQLESKSLIFSHRFAMSLKYDFKEIVHFPSYYKPTKWFEICTIKIRVPWSEDRIWNFHWISQLEHFRIFGANFKKFDADIYTPVFKDNHFFLCELCAQKLRKILHCCHSASKETMVNSTNLVVKFCIAEIKACDTFRLLWILLHLKGRNFTGNNFSR